MTTEPSTWRRTGWMGWGAQRMTPTGWTWIPSVGIPMAFMTEREANELWEVAARAAAKFPDTMRVLVWAPARVSQSRWDRAKRHGYTVGDGSPGKIMLNGGGRGTVLAHCIVVPDSMFVNRPDLDGVAEPGDSLQLVGIGA